MLLLRILKLPNLSLPSLLILAGSFLTRLGNSLIYPYLTLYLSVKKGLPLYWAGCAIGACYLTFALSGFVAGYLSSQYGHAKTLKTAILAYVILIFSMGYIVNTVNNILLIGYFFILLCALAGITRSTMETVGQIIISKSTALGEKYLVFSLRYTLINVGSTLGPIIGTALGLLITPNAFFVAGLFMLFYYCVLFKMPEFKQQEAITISFLPTLWAILCDKQCLYFILAGIAGFIASSQMEALFAYISYINTKSTQVFVLMYAINTTTVVLLQIIITEYVKRFNLNYVILFGLILYACSLLGVALAGKHPFNYYISTFIYTLGEILALSTVGIYIDTQLTKVSKEMSFGISNFIFIGNVIGGPLGTWFCYHWGIKNGLCLMAIITLSGIPCILAAKRASAAIPPLKATLEY